MQAKARQRSSAKEVDVGIESQDLSSTLSTSASPGHQFSKQRIICLFDSLQQEKAILQRLPPSSAYVKHRLKVINRATELLAPLQSNTVPGIDTSELDQLLAALSLS